MKTAYLLTDHEGATKLLFDGKRAHGLAGHKGWTVKEISGQEAFAMLRASLADTFGSDLSPASIETIAQS